MKERRIFARITRKTLEDGLSSDDAIREAVHELNLDVYDEVEGIYLGPALYGSHEGVMVTYGEEKKAHFLPRSCVRLISRTA